MMWEKYKFVVVGSRQENRKLTSAVAERKMQTLNNNCFAG